MYHIHYGLLIYIYIENVPDSQWFQTILDFFFNLSGPIPKFCNLICRSSDFEMDTAGIMRYNQNILRDWGEISDY